MSKIKRKNLRVVKTILFVFREKSCWLPATATGTWDEVLMKQYVVRLTTGIVR